VDTRRSARAFLVGLVVGGALGAGACQSSATFACTASDECESQGAIGTCQPNGYCSFPDIGCISGQRYGEHAGGGFADMCVAPSGASGDTTTGPTDESSTSADTGSVEDGSRDEGTTTDAADSTGQATTSSSDLCLGTLVSDDFSDGVVDAMWMQVLESFIGEGPDGLEFFVTAGSRDGYPQVRPEPAPWNLDEGFVRINITTAPKQPGFQLFTSVFSDAVVIGFGVTGGELTASYNDGSGDDVLGVGAYDDAAQQWLQIRFSAGTMYFETSPDGETWVEFASGDVPLDVTAVTPTITGGNFSDGDNEVVVVGAFEMCAGS